MIIRHSWNNQCIRGGSDEATDQIKHAAFEKTLDYLLEDPERNATKIMDMLDKVAPADLFPSQRTAFRNAIDQQSNWYQLITRLLELNPVMRNDFIKTFLVDGNLMAWPKQETMREKHRCNVPWAILMDPTSACNLHCTGCWAAEYGHQENLSYDELDSIIRQAPSSAPTCTSTPAASRSCASGISSRSAKRIPTARSSRSPTRRS